MKRKASRPIILTMPTFESCATAPPPPRILPFPDRNAFSEPVLESRPPEELHEVRARLYRMIVATQLDRSHGNRAS